VGDDDTDCVMGRMQATWECVDPPSAEPMSLVEARMQTNRATTASVDDPLVLRMIGAARNQVEVDARRSICWQRWKLTIDEWPDMIRIYKCPVISVESVKYTAVGGTLTTLDTTEYVVTYSEPCRIGRAYNVCWPPIADQIGAVVVTFTAGYVVPFTVTASTDALTFTDYEPTNGASFRLSNSGGELPGGLTTRRKYYVVNASGSTCKLSLTSGGAAVDLTTQGTGLHFLGEVPEAAMLSMRKRVAVEFADREGSSIAADCERSYLQSLRAIQYGVL